MNKTQKREQTKKAIEQIEIKPFFQTGTSFKSPTCVIASYDDKYMTKTNKTTMTREEYAKNIISEEIRKSKNRSVFKLGEHENKDAVIESDSEQGLEEKNSKEKQGTLKLICFEKKQHPKQSLKMPANKKNTKLSTYIVDSKKNKNNEQFYSSKSFNPPGITKDYNIKIPRYSMQVPLKKPGLLPSKPRLTSPIYENEYFKTDPYDESTGFKGNNPFQVYNPSFTSPRTGINPPFPQASMIYSPPPGANPFFTSNSDNPFPRKEKILFSPRISYTNLPPGTVFNSSRSNPMEAGGKVSLDRKYYARSSFELSDYVNPDSIKKILKLQKFFRKRLEDNTKKIILIQSFFRRYQLRSLLMKELFRYYKGIAFTNHLEKCKDLFLRRNFKQLCHKVTQQYFYPKNFNVKKLLDKLDMHKLNLLSSKTEIKAFSITKSESVTYTSEKRNKPDYEKLYNQLLDKVEEMKQMFANLKGANLKGGKYPSKIQKIDEKFSEIRKQIQSQFVIETETYFKIKNT